MFVAFRVTQHLSSSPQAIQHFFELFFFFSPSLTERGWGEWGKREGRTQQIMPPVGIEPRSTATPMQPAQACQHLPQCMLGALTVQCMKECLITPIPVINLMCFCLLFTYIQEDCLSSVKSTSGVLWPTPPMYYMLSTSCFLMGGDLEPTGGGSTGTDSH